MTKLINWIKDNKLASFLLLIIFFALIHGAIGNRPMIHSGNITLPSAGMRTEMMSDSFAVSNPSMGSKAMIAPYAPVPPADTKQRMVTTDTSMSLKVDDVSQSISQVETVANQAGGYLIASNISKPEGAASGSISIRVPTDKRSQVLASLRGLAVKVVSENVSGQDITDQYVDNDERLRILNETKAKFEAILASAKNVSDMLEVQRELLNVQQQIDNLKGQQQYLVGSAKLSRVTVYLSTDELALPYAPDTAWRPALVFKEAVRSLVMSLRNLGSLAIWVAVYAPVAIVIMLALWILKKLLQRK